MTGEITLRGRVLPIGGVKEKVLAAHRAGITTVILPRRNQDDLDEVPAEVRNALTFVFADQVEQVLEAALEPRAVEPPVESNGSMSHPRGAPESITDTEQSVETVEAQQAE